MYDSPSNGCQATGGGPENGHRYANVRNIFYVQYDFYILTLSLIILYIIHVIFYLFFFNTIFICKL
jgi:hypothetical protein